MADAEPVCSALSSLLARFSPCWFERCSDSPHTPTLLLYPFATPQYTSCFLFPGLAQRQVGLLPSRLSLNRWVRSAASTTSQKTWPLRTKMIHSTA